MTTHTLTIEIDAPSDAEVVLDVWEEVRVLLKEKFDNNEISRFNVSWGIKD